MKLLTVCIPTYKPPQTLRWCIQSIAEQITQYSLEEHVNIYVTNDASPDNTADVLSELSLDSLDVVNRETNLGMSANIKLMLSEASEKSHYQLIITDDDFLQTESLNIITNLRHQLKILSDQGIWPDNFEVAASSTDGIIAIIHKILPWEGWMWHSENNLNFTSVDNCRLKNIFSSTDQIQICMFIN